MAMNKCGNFIAAGLSSIDFFEEPVQLNVRGKTSTTSSLGGIMSILIVAFLGHEAIMRAISMFNRDSPQVLQINEFQRSPTDVYMDRENNFVFAIVTRMDNNLINMSEASRLSFTAIYQQQYFNDDGILVEHPSIINWAPCNRSNFPANVFPADTYDTFGLFFAYCPTGLNFTNSTGSCPDHIKTQYPNCFTPPDFILQGTIFSSSFKYIRFNVNLCNSTDSTSIYGLQCSPDPRNEILAASGIEFYLAFSNNYLNPDSYSPPYQTFLDYIKWSIHPELSSSAEVYVDMETVKDYDNYFVSDIENSLSFFHISTDKMREQQVFPRDTLLDIMIQRSNLNHITTRNYIKILDVVSDVGGLSELFFFLGAVVSLGYAKYKYFMIISNELYDFEPVEPVEQKKTQKKVVPLNRNEDSVLDQKDSSFIEMLPPVKTIDGEKKGKELSFLQRKKGTALEVNLFQYYKGILWKVLKKRDPKEKLGEKGREKVLKDLDIVSIIEKLKEIDKLKKLIMTQNQIEAFNWTEKPMIRIKKEERKGNVLNHSQSVILEGESSSFPLHDLKEGKDNNHSEWKRLYVAYKNIKEDKDPKNFVYNRRILGMMGEDVVKKFSHFEKQEKIITELKKPEKGKKDSGDEVIDLTRIKS